MNQLIRISHRITALIDHHHQRPNRSPATTPSGRQPPWVGTPHRQLIAGQRAEEGRRQESHQRRPTTSASDVTTAARAVRAGWGTWVMEVNNLAVTVVEVVEVVGKCGKNGEKALIRRLGDG